MLYGAMNFPIHPVLDELEKIRWMGFDYMELAMDPPGAHYSLIRETKKEFVRTLEAHVMGLVCHLPTFVFAADLTDSIRSASLTEILNSMKTARELGAKKAVLHPCMATGLARFVPEKIMENSMESLGVIVEEAAVLGIQLCFENMFPRYGSFFEPAHFSGLFERFPSLFFTLDVAHAHIQDAGKTRIFKLLETFGSRIAHLHLSDNKGRTDDHLPLGKGSIPFEKFAAELGASGYDGTVTFEVFSDNPADVIGSRKQFENLIKKYGRPPA